jgi:AraC-like DNA-binding protein
VFVEAWRIGPRAATGVGLLDRAAARRLLDAAGLGRATDQPADLAELRIALDPVLGRAPELDPRVEHVLLRLARGGSLEDLAAEADLSASWMRTLTRSAVGIPLARLRQWARLRDAVAALGDVSLADAAHAAGFSDQSHLTRLARRLLGRTPGSLQAALALAAHQ